MAGAGAAPPATNILQLFRNISQPATNISPPATNISQLFRMSPLPLPSGVAYGGEVADELEMVEEEVGSVAPPLPMIVICL